MPSSTPKSTPRRVSIFAIAAAVTATVLLTNALHLRVALSDNTSERPPLPVATTTYQMQNSYQRQVRYLGLIVAGARATLSFEVGGLLTTAPLREGTPVNAGDVIATLDTEALTLRRQSVAAELKQVQIDLELAQLREKRQRDLRSNNAISVDTYDQTRLAANSLIAREQSMQARLASIDLQLSKSTLLAPYTGLIADRFVHQGTVVAAGSPVVRLIASSDKEAHVGVSATRAQSLQVGQQYPLALHGETVAATLLSVRPDVDPVTRSTTAVFAVPETWQALDGEPISLLLDEQIAATGGWLPITALQEGKRGTWTVMRVDPDADNELQAIREAVEVIEIRGQEAFVRGTLENNAQVIANGLHRVIPGSRVQLQGAR